MAYVTYEKRDRIAHITLDRPNKLNALTPEMAQELAMCWERFRDDENAWAAVLSGNGKAFCAGRDVSTLGADWSGRNSMLFGERPVMPTAYRIWKPIVVALQGYVMGAGLAIALSCDLRVVAEDAEFGLPEPKAGIPTVFSPLLPRFMPYSMACELALLGGRVSAQRAYEIGVANRLVPPGEQLPEAAAIAETLCRNGPLAVRAMKESMLRSQDMDYHGAVAFAEHIFGPVMRSLDAEEGRKAFIEKRKPVWRGI